MDVAKVRCILENETGLAPIPNVKVKIKSKGNMYYTADIGGFSDCPDDYYGLSLADSIALEARRKVSWLLGQMDGHDGWWFEDYTMWISKSEIGMIFADVILSHQGGIVMS